MLAARDHVEADPVRPAAAGGDGRLRTTPLRRRERPAAPARDRGARNRVDDVRVRLLDLPRGPPEPRAGELPGVCAHFIVDTDGAIYQLVGST